MKGTDMLVSVKKGHVDEVKHPKVPEWYSLIYLVIDLN